MRTDKVFTVVNYAPGMVSTYDAQTMANKITRRANNVTEGSAVRSGVWVPKQDMVMLGFSKGEILFTQAANLKDMVVPTTVVKLTSPPNGMTLFNDVVIIASDAGVVYFLPARVAEQSELFQQRLSLTQDLYSVVRSHNPNSIGEFILLSSQGVHFRTLASNGLGFNEDNKSHHLLDHGMVTSLAVLTPSHVVFMAPTSTVPLIHFDIESKTVLRNIQWPGSIPVEVTATPEGRLVVKDTMAVWLQ